MNVGAIAPVLAAAATLGLMGSAHCVTMCGGVASLLCAGTGGEAGSVSPPAALGRSSLFSLGRIGTYALLGALAGLAGERLGAAGVVGRAGTILRLVADGLLVLAGLHLAGWLPAVLGSTGALPAAVSRGLGRAVAVLSTTSSPLALVALGAVWGWMPCGLVYTALALCTATGSAGVAALGMLVFGVATAPGLIATGALAPRMLAWASAPALRAAAGTVVALAGLLMLGRDAGIPWDAPGLGGWNGALPAAVSETGR